MEKMRQQQNIKIVEISGTPYERGFQHGQAVSDQIKQAVKDWKLSLHRNHLRDPEAYLKNFLDYENFKPAIERWAPDMLDEVRGIADGAKIDFDTMYAFQLMDEEWIYGVKELMWKKDLDPQQSEAGQNCSVVGIYDQPNAPSYLAQNMDLGGWTRKYPILLKINYNDFQVMVLSFAGFVGLTGMNNRGLGMCCNTLFNLDHCHDGLPVAFTIRRILEMSNLAKAKGFVKSVKHASGQTYTIGTKGEIGAYECSADKVVKYVPDHETSRIFHTNHAIVNDDNDFFKQYESTKSADFQQGGPDNSQCRYAALEKRLGKHVSKVTINDIKAALRSHDDPHNPVCVDTHNVVTLGSVIYELCDTPKMLVTKGAPCKSIYQTLVF